MELAGPQNTSEQQDPLGFLPGREGARPALLPAGGLSPQWALRGAAGWVVFMATLSLWVCAHLDMAQTVFQ